MKHITIGGQISASAVSLGCMRMTSLDEKRADAVIDCAIDKDEFVLPMLPPGGSMDDIIVKVGD